MATGNQFELSLPGDYSTFRYRTLFISDLHLGSNKTATPYLYEFLKHLDFSTLKHLYLVGDVIGGWEHVNERQQAFPEMERRILDILNYAAANGVTVHYIPGNHDERLRPILHILQKRRSFETFGPNVLFEQETVYETEGPDKKRIKIVHGDQHDPGLFVKPWFRPITYMVSAGYDIFVKVNYLLSNFMYRHFGKHVSFAKNLKNAFKDTINFFFSQKSLLKGLENTSIDGILMGHTHMAGIQVFEHQGRKSYLINDGDWVESSTAAYVDDPAELPKILHYKQERERLGFGHLPYTGDAHPAHFAAYRYQTDRQVRLIHHLWPSQTRGEVVRQFNEARIALREHQRDHKELGEIMMHLQATSRVNAPDRKKLLDIVGDTKSESYGAQKKGLAHIFNTYAADEALAGDDLTFVKTVVREFGVRSERKMQKYGAAMKEAADRLDLRLPKHDMAV